ncbi:restriction endonuclease subunit S [Oceanibaculum nanhaiense]|uniref:restriction endonuclease subunit S n=1 Tax=Oceanibaculum nanhaiense TaxID=1909734 RepID=UPI003F703B92
MSGEVPKSWKKLELGFFCTEHRRRAKSADIPIFSVSKDYGLIAQAELFGRRIASANTSNYKTLKRGEYAYDPMLLWTGSIGCLWRSSEAMISPAYTTFGIDNKVVLPKFFDTLIKMPRMVERYRSISHGTNVRRKKAHFDDFSALVVAIPPLAEQHAIADVLSAVEEAIAKTKALVDALIATKNEILEDRLRISTQAGWEICRLRDVATIRTGISKSKDRQFKDPLSVPYLRVANVQDGYIDLEEIKMITIEQDQLGRYSLQKGDVLFNEGGDFDKLGRGCVWSGQISPCVHQNHVFAVRCKPKLNPEFLALLAASRKGKAYFRLSSKQTTNLASINTSDLRSFPVLLPPMDEQLKIAAIAKTFDQRATAERASLALLVEMRTALSQELLSGRLRLPDSIIARHRGKAGQAA